MSGTRKNAGTERMSLTRRALLKTTTNALVGWIALAVVLSSGTVTAGSSDGMSTIWLAAAALREPNPADTPPADPRQQSADLLRRARQAIAENDFAVADSLISQADALGVKYSIFYQGDTPERARRDLERKRASATPAKPSGLFSPFSLDRGKAVPSADPFAGHPIDPPAAGQQVTPLPRIDSATGQGPNNSNVANNSPLRTARLALAVGDLRRAAEFVERAKAMRVNYQPSDDTPDKVTAAIQKQQEIQQLDKTTEAYTRVCSRSLMDQSDALLRWGEYDEAERLAGRAAALRIVYGPFEQRPQELIQRIAAARRQSGNAVAPPMAAGYANAAAATPGLVSRQAAVQLVRQAREAIAAGRLDQAEILARQAEQMRLPDNAFAPGEDRPALLLLDLQELRRRMPSGVVPAGGQLVPPADPNGVTRAVYDPANDPTRNMPASGQRPAFDLNPQICRPATSTPRIRSRIWLRRAPRRCPCHRPRRRPEGSVGTQSQGLVLFQQGEAALKAHDPTRAYQLFREASNYSNELDPVAAQRLQDHLQLLSAPSRTGLAPLAGQGPNMANQAATQQQLLLRQVQADLAHSESNARAMRATDPKGSLAILEQARKKVETADVDAASRDQLLRGVDRAIAETKQVIAQNRPQIELNEKNDRIRQEVARQQQVRVEVQQKIAMLIDQFNRMEDEQRYAEAEVVAKQAAELAPNDPVVTQVLWQAKFIRRYQEAKSIQSQKEENFVIAMGNVDKDSIPFDDNKPILFPNDGKDWPAFTKARLKYAGGRERPKSEREIEIQKKLCTPVSLQFTNAPLEPGHGLPGQAGGSQLAPRSDGLERGRRDHRHPGHHQPAQRDHAQERLEPDPRAVAFELRDQGRGVESHQRTDARRPGIHEVIPRRRPRHSDSELCGDADNGVGGGV